MAPTPFLRTGAPRMPIWCIQRPLGTSFLVHGGFEATAWLIGVTTDRLDYKDIIWGAAPVANAWYQAVGIPVLQNGVELSVALKGLGWRQSLLLGGITTWGLRLAYHMASGSLPRGYDDTRYEKLKLQKGFWRKALFKMYLPETILQALLSLPIVVPLRTKAIALHGWGWTDIAAVALFGAATTLEVLADYQKRRAIRRGHQGLYTGGLWSVVRHPNLLGDALTFLSFGLLSINTPAFHPALFLGPATNYFFLRVLDGDRAMEAYQEDRYARVDPNKLQQLRRYQRLKNSFWPDLAELGNVWTWVIVGAGASAVVLERVARDYLKPEIL